MRVMAVLGEGWRGIVRWFDMWFDIDGSGETQWTVAVR